MDRWGKAVDVVLSDARILVSSGRVGTVGMGCPRTCAVALHACVQGSSKLPALGQVAGGRAG